MEAPKIADEARAVLAEAERADPVAHGYTPKDLLDLAEMLRAAAASVQLRAEADREEKRAAKLARSVLKPSNLTTDDEAIGEAGALAIRLLGTVAVKP